MKELKVISNGRYTKKRTLIAAAHGDVTYAFLRNSQSPKRNQPPPSTKGRSSPKLARISTNRSTTRLRAPLCRLPVVGYTWGLFNIRKSTPRSYTENCILEYPPGACDLMCHNLKIVIHHVLALNFILILSAL